MTGKKGWAAASVTAIALATASPGLAYILPTDAILSKVGAHRSELSIDTVVVQGTRTRGDQTSKVWWAFKTGKGHRLQVQDASGTAVTLTVGDRRWSFTLGGAAGSPSRIKSDLFQDLLFPKSADPGGKRGETFLGKNGIDGSEVSLSRQDGHIAYVIGAKPWETSKPQLWIDKELRVPLRLITVNGNVVEELRLLGYGSELVDQWFPRRIERWENGALVEVTEISAIEVNAALDKDLLAPPQ
ncbi:MAG: hypothetical protein H6730_18140 [Deltaproteobacteria bacterium]|nr:hypothetical protein [Deltaproteobacteria bacterium]